MAIDIENLITINKAIELCGFSRSSLFRWMRRDKEPLPYYQPGGKGGRRMFDIDQFNKWFRKQQIGINRGNQFDKK